MMEPSRLCTRHHWLGSSLFLAALLVPGIAHADNLGGLIYLVAIWPLNALMFLLLLIVAIVAGFLIRATSRGKSYPKFGITLMVLPVLVCLASPTMTFILDNAFDARGDAIAILISIVPSILISIICFILGLVLFLKRKGRPQS